MLPSQTFLRAVPNPTPASAQSLREIHERLLEAYGPQRWWPARTPFEVIVGAYLVQNTSWRGVVRSIANIEERGVLHLDGLRAIAVAELRVLIRPSGFMMRKADALKAFVTFLDEQYGGSLEALAAEPTDTLRVQLLALTGVGPETADAILLYALGHPVMVVDAYLRRVATRHGLLEDGASYATVQRLALSAFASDPPATLVQHCNEFHALVVEVGKNHCKPRPRCEECPLAPLLP